MEHKDVCFEIENDDFYRQILNDPCKQFPDKLKSVSEKIDKLNKGIEKLNLELESQVLSKHHDLLTQASHATNLETVIGSMQLDAQSLLNGIEKLRSQILIPCNMLENQTTILGRIQKVCHIMRYSSKIIDYCKGLSLEKTPSIQASLLYEVEQIINDGDFDGIDLLAGEIQMIKQLKTNIIENASQQLQNGLINGEKALLLSSFNIFNNLHCAKERINVIVSSELDTVVLNIQNALKIQVPNEAINQGPGKTGIINNKVYRKIFWDSMDKLFNEHLHYSCKKIILLQNSLNDLHTFENFKYIAKGFWTKVSNAFCTELRKCPPIANQCVETDYPKLLKCFNSLCTKLHYKHFTIQRDLLSHWENIFLSKALTRLLDPVRTMWQHIYTPTPEHIDEAVRTISTSLSLSIGDKQLTIAQATSVSKCIRQMCTEAEQRVCVDNDAGQVVEAPTSSQQRNAELSNILYYFSKRVNRVLANMLSVLSAESINIIQESLKDISNISVLQPFYISINASIDLILNSMHSEMDSSVALAPGPGIPSLYMRELQEFIKRCKETYFSLYEDTSAVNRCCEEVASHTVKMFAYNVCSIRPVTPYIRKKLIMDTKQLNVALNPFVTDINVLIGIKDLRDLYHVLMTSTIPEVMELQEKGHPLSQSTVMFHLFSYGSENLLSPYQCAGWSQQQFVQWLYKHQTERERVEFIAGALQRYQNFVMQNKLSTYDEIYPCLLQLLKEAQADL